MKDSAEIYFSYNSANFNGKDRETVSLIKNESKYIFFYPFLYIQKNQNLNWNSWFNS